MKKNGFTLIELLAVIIVLAIVALIATPIVLNVVEDAKKSAAESEANLVFSGIKNFCATEELKKQMDSNYTVKCVNDATSKKLNNVAAMVTTKATVEATVDNYKVTSLTVTMNDYTYVLNGAKTAMSLSGSN